jgi:hypothetical protein
VRHHRHKQITMGDVYDAPSSGLSILLTSVPLICETP